MSEQRLNALEAVAESATELMAFLSNNIDHDNPEDGNIEIKTTAKHADSLCALMTDLDNKLKAL